MASLLYWAGRCISHLPRQHSFYHFYKIINSMRFSIFTFLLCLTASCLWAQESILVVNGGIFGTTNYANATVQLPGASTTVVAIDTIRVTSIQDLLIDEDNYVAYVAAQDSIVKLTYNNTSGTRVVAADFGAPSTIKLGLYQDKLLVGNFYAPFGQVGPYNNHLRVFDADDLSFIDTITAITKPAKDFVVVGDYAYVAQNNTTSGFADTLGYLAVIDLRDYSLVRHDTLGNNGEEIGRLVVVGDVIYSVNGGSNTISSYNITTGAKNTVATNVNLQPRSYGSTLFSDSNGVCYMPYNDSIGTYNLVANRPVEGLIHVPSGFAFTVNMGIGLAGDVIAVSHIDYTNQNLNRGVVYDERGDSISVFQVGYSPEALAFVFSIPISTNKRPDAGNDLAFSCFPNPTADHLTLTLEKEEPVVLRVLDGLGRAIMHQAIYTQNTTLDVQNLPSGLYYLSIINEKGHQRTQAFHVNR